LVPIYDYAEENKELASKVTEEYYTCCGKRICGGCVHSFHKSGNDDKCPFCNSDLRGKTDEECIHELMKRVEVNDADAICQLGNSHYHGRGGLLQDRNKAMELWTQAANLGSNDAHYHLGSTYEDGGDIKKAKFHYESAAMAGDESARYNLGLMEGKSGNMERSIKHLTIAASGGHHISMNVLRSLFVQGFVSRESIDSTVTTYNHSCAEMRSEARDAYIQSVCSH
jgi:TPR repeat protein